MHLSKEWQCTLTRTKSCSCNLGLFDPEAVLFPVHAMMLLGSVCPCFLLGIISFRQTKDVSNQGGTEKEGKVSTDYTHTPTWQLPVCTNCKPGGRGERSVSFLPSVPAKPSLFLNLLSCSSMAPGSAREGKLVIRPWPKWRQNMVKELLVPFIYR